MKKIIIISLALAFLCLSGMTLSVLGIDTFETSAFAGGPANPGQGNDGSSHHKAPEPATLGLIAAGIAGVGVYAAIRRKRNK